MLYRRGRPNAFLDDKGLCPVCRAAESEASQCSSRKKISAHVLYVDYSRGNGTALFRLVCQLHLEGIMAKWADSRYEDNPNDRKWIKTKNPAYSQKEGREDLFKRGGTNSFRFHSDPLTSYWRRLRNGLTSC